MSADFDGGPVVVTTAGYVRGGQEENVTVFRGVPYAEPPIGDRRWRPAEPHQGWSGIRDATADGPISVQLTGGPFQPILGNPQGDAIMDEDCLTVTVWTPASDDRRRPVMVWFHGGGFITGAGSWDIYSGAALAAHGDVVVVAVNYRTGPMGYLYIGSDDPAGGNFGLTDQRMAMQWVEQNIAGFGGDPDQVTLFGQSAGAWSIAALLTSPNPPAVRRAILQSPPLGECGRTREESEHLTELYMNVLDVDSVEELRKISAHDLMAAVPQLMGHIFEWGKLVLPFQPTVDGRTIRRPMMELLRDCTSEVELMIGWTRREMSFFFGSDPQKLGAERERVVERMRDSFADNPEAAYDHYIEHMPGASAAEVLIAYGGDRQFRAPSIAVAQARAERGQATWLYEFDVSAPAFGGWLDACHCMELPFVFQTGDAWHRAGSGLFDGFDFARHTHLADVVQNAWLQFARDGGQAVAAEWPTYAPAQTVMRFADRSAPTKDHGSGLDHQ